MKKTFLLFCLFVITFDLSAQTPTITGTHLKYNQIIGKDTITVILFDSIAATTKIEYSGTTIKWYKFSDTITPNSTFNYIYPDNATGYVVDVDGKNDTLWVIDYSKLKPTFISFEAEYNPKNQCDDVNLKLNAIVPAISYKTFDGILHNLPARVFTVTYNTLEWTDKWKDISTSVKDIDLPTSTIKVPAPLCDTYFTLSGDQYAKDLGLPPFTFKSSILYKAVAVKCYPASIVTVRNEKNEAERPSLATQISGSAPLDIQFISNANEPVATYYKWTITKGAQQLITRTDKEIRYTFADAGAYNVKLEASNDYCSNSDSIKITVAESAIYAPNVFTPNGDGLNDEFRVAYKSIISFQAWVYNRWGRLVYTWTDPQKGWDGNISGRKASAGPYYYVIKALGSDFDANSAPIGKTKLRLGEYLLKGDINIIRNKE
ncbi:MAG: gliding motility-associated C-terminal domain-containing protein [Paludibacter sp.]